MWITRLLPGIFVAIVAYYISLSLCICSLSPSLSRSLSLALALSLYLSRYLSLSLACSSALCLRLPLHTFVVPSLFFFLGVCNFFKSVLSLSPIIMAQTEICTRNLRLSEEEEGGGGEKKKEVEEEGRERERKAQRKGKRNVTAEAQWVGGECRRGRTWSWLCCSLQLVSSH